MKIIHEYTPKLYIPQGVTLSCLLQEACTFYGVSQKKKCLYRFQNDEATALRTNRGYYKMARIPQAQAYMMSCHEKRGTPNVLYVLDDGLKEINSIHTHSHKIEDIFFDEELRLILVVTPYSIQKYNCNGDYLGALMNTHKKRRYKSLCTFGKFIFLAYQKETCVYIASYNLAGAYLEQISLGCEYAVQNMQVVIKDPCPVLCVYAIKNSCYPFFIEIGLSGKQDAHPACITHEKFQIECVNEDKTMQTTAYIKSR